MNMQALIRPLEVHATAIKELIEGVNEDQARWKPDPASWSVLEVINHLYDEEREDFRTRLDIILHRPHETAPPIDPQGWVVSRRYNEKDLRISTANFLAERTYSVEWLRGLDSPDFDSFVEGKFGRMSAGDMFAAWVAHDLLHLRQLIELKFLYDLEFLSPYKPDYAGDW